MEETSCKFIPTRRNQKTCKSKVTTPYGYCTRHSKSVQAKKAKLKYEAEQSKESEEPEPTPPRTPSPVVEEPEPKTKTVRRKRRIGPNKWGRFEDPKTHIVFDPHTKVAYGLQSPTGKILQLTEKEIKICERNGWSYDSVDAYEAYDVSSEEVSEELTEEVSEELTEEDGFSEDQPVSEEGSEEQPVTEEDEFSEEVSNDIPSDDIDEYSSYDSY